MGVFFLMMPTAFAFNIKIVTNSSCEISPRDLWVVLYSEDETGNPYATVDKEGEVEIHTKSNSIKIHLILICTGLN